MKRSTAAHRSINRRRLLQLGSSAVFITALPGMAVADESEMIAVRTALFGERKIETGRVRLKLPPIAENGYSVPLSVSVDSPMTADDYVKRIVILSPRNPKPDVARFELGPRAGRAEISTRIRMAGAQSIDAIAEMNDGTLWSGSQYTLVTLAACVIL